jgi:hypothetical protein
MAQLFSASNRSYAFGEEGAARINQCPEAKTKIPTPAAQVPTFTKNVKVGQPRQVEACLNAKRSASQSAPRGTYGRHCQCDCSKR